MPGIIFGNQFSYLKFGHWILEFIWSLEFGNWDLTHCGIQQRQVQSSSSRSLLSGGFWPCLPFFNPFRMPEIKSHRTIKTMPMAKKLGAPIFIKKSEKYSTVSIELILSKNQSLRKAYMPNFGLTRISTVGWPERAPSRPSGMGGVPACR